MIGEDGYVVYSLILLHPSLNQTLAPQNKNLGLSCRHIRANPKWKFITIFCWNYDTYCLRASGIDANSDSYKGVGSGISRIISALSLSVLAPFYTTKLSTLWGINSLDRWHFHRHHPLHASLFPVTTAINHVGDARASEPELHVVAAGSLLLILATAGAHEEYNCGVLWGWGRHLKTWKSRNTFFSSFIGL